MRKPRSAYSYFPGEAVIRVICHSSFGGPWEGMFDEEREELLEDLHDAAAFHEISVIAFSIQPTSFDLLLDVPREVNLSKREMMKRLRAQTPEALMDGLEKRLKSDQHEWDRQRARFGDLGTFLKRFKQVAASRYHRLHGTRGNLWSSRYLRSFIEPGHASRVLAAWVDQAAVRAGEVDRPGDDPWSTFGRAEAGDSVAREMIAEHFAESGKTQWRSVSRAYSDFISDDADPPGAPRGHKGKPLLKRPELLRVDVPQFRKGLAIGSREFVERFYQLNRAEFHPDRQVAARRIGGQNDPALWSIRAGPDLRKHSPTRMKRASGKRS